jgi:hypothetical protein
LKPVAGLLLFLKIPVHPTSFLKEELVVFVFVTMADAFSSVWHKLVPGPSLHSKSK